MSKTQEELLALTPDQEKASAELKRAFTACTKAGVYLWDDYGTIAAVNGRNISHLGTDESYGEEVDRNHIRGVNPKCWHSGNADDPIYIERR